MLKLLNQLAIIMILLHGTTRSRAEKIVAEGPNPRLFHEPGSQTRADGFSMNIENGPFFFGDPAEYAVGKAQEYPDEGGPVILAVDVPREIVQKAENEWFPLSQGLVQFDPGNGLEQLLAAWATLKKEIRSIG